MADSEKNLFNRLTRLFRSGPSVKRRVKGYSKQGATTSALQSFRKSQSEVYNAALGSYNSFDRMTRYSDFAEMEATAEISAALDIYASEICSQSEKGRILHIHSDNSQILELLETLFYDTLNTEFHLPLWVRTLVKFGDFFLFNDVSPEFGVINAFPISISDMEREENFDPSDPAAVRFRWITNGNQVLENWQITHFRLLGNDAFLPYGSSVLEGARRIWRQLILMEDAMLVYRIIRAPERRIFYIDVGNVPPDQIDNYMEQAKTSLRRNQIADKTSGNIDLRYNPLSVDSDYFLPVRGGSDDGTKIDTLPGGQNTAAIEDVEYIQKKLFAALKIPRAYLGYDESVGSKATLAQEDIRFSRTIQHIQKTVIAELSKMATIHLMSHGYEDEDLLDYTLQLANPSAIAQQQKLELVSAKFDVCNNAPEGIVDRDWLRINILEFTSQEIDDIKKGLFDDKKLDTQLDMVAGGGGGEGAPGIGGGGGGGGLFDSPDSTSFEDSDFGGDEGGDAGGGGDDEGPTADVSDSGGDDLDDLFAGDKTPGRLLTSKLSETDTPSISDEDAPERAEKKINAFGDPITPSRKVRHGREETAMPDFASMVGIGKSTRQQDSMNNPFDSNFLKNPFREATNQKPYDEFLDSQDRKRKRMSRKMEKSLSAFSTFLNKNKPAKILTENSESGDFVDIVIEDEKD